MDPRTTENFAVIDIGAGDGRLLRDLSDRLNEGISFIGVDVRPRPVMLVDVIDWVERDIDPDAREITGRDGDWSGLLIAHEFLDDVPCDVVELDEHCVPHVVLVDTQSGAEEIGPALDDPAAHRYVEAPALSAQWLAQWWPATRPYARREIGLSRDRMWARLRRVLRSGQAIAVDYGHRFSDRQAGMWDAGTLKGFVAGRPHRAVPDGSVNITAHVALDACASPTANVHSQSSMLAGLAGFPGGRGSFDWLIEPWMDESTVGSMGQW